MFFAPPAVIETKVVATYPKELRTADETNDWCMTQPLCSHHSSLLEGHSFDRRGNLWCVEIPTGRILRASPEGVFSVVTEHDGWPNGLRFHKDGRVFIADAKQGVMLLDPVKGRVTPYLVR